jgi:predicted XRE-type DNA-binding protein
MKLKATEKLLVAAGYMKPDAEGNFMVVPYDTVSPLPKLDFYWVVPFGRFADWKIKGPMTVQEGPEVAKAIGMYVNHFVLSLAVDQPRAVPAVVHVKAQPPWQGKAVVVTGRFRDFSKEEVQTMAKKMGAKIQEKFGGKTSLVIKGYCNASATQIKKAVDSKIQVMDQEEFIVEFQQSVLEQAVTSTSP